MVINIVPIEPLTLDLPLLDYEELNIIDVWRCEDDIYAKNDIAKVNAGIEEPSKELESLYSINEAKVNPNKYDNLWRVEEIKNLT